ncbi:MAG TPA: DUF1330 domain-containing protein [Pseudolabrys sp.]|jgi:uncharacterized protein (DUF1330 family)
MAKKGYWIARLSIHDQAAYDAYRDRNGAVFAAHGGRFLVRGGPFETAFGDARKHNVVLEFPSYEAAKTCFQSEAYQTISKDLKRGAEVDLIIIEGYDGD